MSQKLYKATFSFLKTTSEIKVEGQHLKRLTKLSAMIYSCMTSMKSRLESLSKNYDGKAFQKERSCLNFCKVFSKKSQFCVANKKSTPHGNTQQKYN